jgi:hypothetical protein
MRRFPVWLAAFAVVAACSAGGTASLPVSGHARIYHDSSGWSMKIPAGWRALPFSDTRGGITATGVQLSNVRLPLPSLIPGYPIQVNDRVLPGRGIGLIIAADPDPRLSRGPVEKPPLPAPNGRYWSMGSSPAGDPYLETLWFRAHGMTFIASAKIGSLVTSHQLTVVAAVIRSLR